MKKLLLIAVFSLFAANALFAQKAKKETVQELMNVMQIDSTMDKTFSTMIPSLISSMKDMYLDSNKSDAYNDGFSEMYDALTSELLPIIKGITKKMLDEDFVEMYQKFFTEQEINDFIKFYKSPAGHKYIEVTPQMTTEMTGIMMRKYMPLMQEKVQDVLKEKINKMKNPPLKKS